LVSVAKTIVAAVVPPTLFLGWFLLSEDVKDRVRSELNATIERRDIVDVSVNGRESPSFSDVLSALRLVSCNLPYHHSHPANTPIIVRIVPKHGDEMVIWLNRDSDYTNEYWVTSPRYRTNTEIGCSITGEFDAIGAPSPLRITSIAVPQ
jgi:hypothetical protein